MQTFYNSNLVITLYLASIHKTSDPLVYTQPIFYHALNTFML